MDAKERKRLESAVWAKTHRDFKGTLDGKRNIMVGTNKGVALVFFDELTDAELEQKARDKGILPALPVVPCKVCGGKSFDPHGNGEGRERCFLCDTVRARDAG